MKRKGFGSVFGPLDPETERRLVLLVHVELHTLATVAVPGTLIIGTGAVLFDVIAHAGVIGIVRIKICGRDDPLFCH